MVFYLIFMVKANFLWVEMISNLYFSCLSFELCYTFPHDMRVQPGRYQSRTAAVCSSPCVCWCCSSRPADCVTAEPRMPSVNSVASLGLPPLLSHSSPWNYISLMSLKLSLKFMDVYWKIKKLLRGEWQWDHCISLVSLGNLGNQQNSLD